MADLTSILTPANDLELGSYGIGDIEPRGGGSDVPPVEVAQDFKATLSSRPVQAFYSGAPSGGAAMNGLAHMEFEPPAAARLGGFRFEGYLGVPELGLQVKSGYVNEGLRAVQTATGTYAVPPQYASHADITAWVRRSLHAGDISGAYPLGGLADVTFEPPTAARMGDFRFENYLGVPEQGLQVKSGYTDEGFRAVQTATGTYTVPPQYTSREDIADWVDRSLEAGDISGSYSLKEAPAAAVTELPDFQFQWSDLAPAGYFLGLTGGPSVGGVGHGRGVYWVAPAPDGIPDIANGYLYYLNVNRSGEIAPGVRYSNQTTGTWQPGTGKEERGAGGSISVNLSAMGLGVDANPSFWWNVRQDPKMLKEQNYTGPVALNFGLAVPVNQLVEAGMDVAGHRIKASGSPTGLVIGAALLSGSDALKAMRSLGNIGFGYASRGSAEFVDGEMVGIKINGRLLRPEQLAAKMMDNLGSMPAPPSELLQTIDRTLLGLSLGSVLGPPGLAGGAMSSLAAGALVDSVDAVNGLGDQIELNIAAQRSDVRADAMSGYDSIRSALQTVLSDAQREGQYDRGYFMQLVGAAENFNDKVAAKPYLGPEFIAEYGVSNEALQLVDDYLQHNFDGLHKIDVVDVIE